MEKKINQKKLKNFIDQCINQCEGKEFIFRGTTQRFSCDENGKPRKDGVSSSLYREHKDIFIEHFHPIDIEKEYVERAKAKCFPKKTSNIEILTEICHFHGKTTLIDFTKNIHIALFFACDGEFEKNGELLYLDTQKMKQKDDIDYDIADEKGRLEAKRIEPAIVQTSRNRVIFQSSVFVHAPEGYINQDTLYCSEIPSDYKKQILEYLRTCHNIYADTIYNDLLGFIMNQENYKTAHVEFYTGLSCQKNEKHKEAIQHYDEAIRLKPDVAGAYNNRGLAKHELDLYKEAIQDYDEAIRIKPDYAGAHYNRGNARHELGLHEEAIQHYDEAIRIKPDYIDAYTSRGNAKYSLGLYQEAIQDYDEAIRIKPDYAGAHYNRGKAKHELGLHKEAIQHYDEAIRLKPDDAMAYSNRGNAKHDLGLYEKAIQDYDEAIRIKPDSASAYNNRGNAKCSLGLHKEAIQDYDEAIKLKPDSASAYNNRGNAKHGLGLHKEAIQDYDEAIRIKPDDADAHNNLALAKKKLDSS